MSDKSKSGPTSPTSSPNWNTTTKIFIAAFLFILLSFTFWRLSALIGPLVIAGMIAYVFNPLIALLDEHTPMSRGVAIGVVYILFAMVVVGALTAASVTLYQQTLGLYAIVQELVLMGPERFNEFISQPLQIGSRTIELSKLNLDLVQVSQQLFSAIQPVLSQSGQFIGQAATATASGIGWAIVTFVLSIYFAIDLPRFGGLIGDAAQQPGYRRDAERILSEFGRIWSGYLRGQTILAIIMSICFTVTLSLLGVRFALVLGLLAGVLDFFPYIGPFIVVTLSALVATLQGSNWLGLSPIWFGVVVLLAGLILQQIEGNWLNPRIMGEAIGLHPMLVMVGALMGGILGGILGIMLAAPVLATVKLLGTYTWRKMFDLDPFPEPDSLTTTLTPAEEITEHTQVQDISTSPQFSSSEPKSR